MSPKEKKTRNAIKSLLSKCLPLLEELNEQDLYYLVEDLRESVGKREV